MRNTCVAFNGGDTRIQVRLGLLLVVFVVGSVAVVQSEAAQPRTCEEIRQMIASLPSRGGLINLRADTYTCGAPIVIDRDNVDLRGKGPATVIRLADGANSPVVVIGQTLPAPTVARRNIHLSDLVIDGNRVHQPDECWGGDCAANPIRNNGITLRRVEDVVIERVTVFGARSGGLVAERGCRRLTIRDFTSFDNQFDGLAAYETENSRFSGLHLYSNPFAGLSFDVDFNNNVVSDAVLAGNGKQGIFMRDSRDNLFQGLQIRDSGEDGLFLAQVEGDPAAPASGNTFSGMVVSNSTRAGMRVNDASCVDNLVIGSQFVGNIGGCISEVVPGLVQTVGTPCR